MELVTVSPLITKKGWPSVLYSAFYLKHEQWKTRCHSLSLADRHYSAYNLISIFFTLLYQNSITDRLSSSAYNSLFCFIKTQSRIVSRPPHTRNLSSKYQGQGSKPPINQTLSPDTRLKSQTSDLLEPFSKNQDRDIQNFDLPESYSANKAQESKLKTTRTSNHKFPQGSD